MKDELHDVLSGKSEVRFGAVIQTIACYLRESKKASVEIKDSKHFKNQETKQLEDYSSQHNFLIDDIDFSQYVSEGAEQRVFLKDSEYVIKLNDAIYYTSWQDYFYNLLLHNYFFYDTAYELIGFTKDNGILYAVVKQNFVEADFSTDLQMVKLFLEQNGFINS